MKIIQSLFILLLTAGIQLQAMQQTAAPAAAAQQPTHNNLALVADRYTQCITRLGKTDVGDLISFMKTIFASDCHTTVNGSLESTSLSQLYDKMMRAKKELGAFTVTCLSPFVVDNKKNLAVVHYRIATKGPIHVVIKYLKCDSHGFIQGIDEVFNTGKPSELPRPLLTTQDQKPEIDVLRALKIAAGRYTQFMTQFGQADTGDLKALMKATFTENCHKIVNDELAATTIPELHAQISKAKGEVGLFTVEIITPFVTDAEKNLVVVHYRIATKSGGTIIVIKYLKCDNNGQIREIDEVFNTIRK